MSDEVHIVMNDELCMEFMSMVHKHAKRLDWSGGCDMGMYVIVLRNGQARDIHFTFLSGEGEIPSITFMLGLREEIDDALFKHFGGAWNFCVFKATSSWELEDCDILTRCAEICGNGILFQNGDTPENSICRVVDGRGPSAR